MHAVISSSFITQGKQYLHFIARNLISPDSYLLAPEPASSSLSVQHVASEDLDFLLRPLISSP